MFFQEFTRTGRIIRWLEGVAKGEPANVITFIVFLIVLVFVGVGVIMIKRKEDREEEAATKNK